MIQEREEFKEHISNLEAGIAGKDKHISKLCAINEEEKETYSKQIRDQSSDS